MCDEKDQLPGSVPMFTRIAGSATAPNASGAVNLSFETVRYCYGCGYWHTGHCADGGTAVFPQPFYPQPVTRPAPEALAALRRLADELARLTLNMGQDEQAGVWAAYYELQAELSRAGR